MRMESIRDKSNEEYMTQLNYAFNMASAITEPGKAMARGYAAQEIFGEHSAVAAVFFERAYDLGGEDVKPAASVNAFDNVDARAAACKLYNDFPRFRLIHAGVSADRTGEILWNKDYKLPTVRVPRGHNPICTHELGASILRFTAALCANIIEDWIETGNERSVVITQDWRVLG